MSQQTKLSTETLAQGSVLARNALAFERTRDMLSRVDSGCHRIRLD